MKSPLELFSEVTRTANGLPALATTGSKCLDLFGRVGSSRGLSDSHVVGMFNEAAVENFPLALAIMNWSRDARMGAGERRAYRLMLKELESWCDSYVDTEAATKLMSNAIDRAVELGRWDDIFVLDKFFFLVVAKVVVGLAENNQLLLKWLPREKSSKGAIAKRLMKGLGLTPKQYRKLCSGVVTAETLMCANKWKDIELSKVPSIAIHRYQKAFARKHPGYSVWVDQLSKGEAKINASVTFPHSVYVSARSGGYDHRALEAMWKALPNFIPEGAKVLPIVDTSGSMMDSSAAGCQCLDVSIGLGLYIAEKNDGPFKNMMITFDDNPKLVWIDDSKGLINAFNQVAQLDWGGSTDFIASYRLILNAAVAKKIPQSEMPTALVCLSDMQFNSAGDLTGFEQLKADYKAAGYEPPVLVFWNLNARYANFPVGQHDENAVLVSGFSASVLTSALSAKAKTPFENMVDTVFTDRYRIF